MQPTAFTCYADEIEVGDLILTPDWETAVITAVVTTKHCVLLWFGLKDSGWQLALHPDQPVEVLER